LIADVNSKLVALKFFEIERQRKKMPMDPTFLALITGPGKTPEASVALGCTGSGCRFEQERAAGDSRAKEPIRSNILVDNGKRDADRSSGESLRDSGEEQSKVEKLQH
jgi:hypothetical protein